MTEPFVEVKLANPRRGVADIDVYPQPGAERHRIGYLRGHGWWCMTCDPQSKGAGKRCPWIRTAREHSDVPDMEGI